MVPTQKVRSFKSYSKQFLFSELKKIDWNCILSSADVNFCLAEFTRLFKVALDTVAPYREVRVRKDSNPWMNSIILSGIRKRDALFGRFKKNRGNEKIYRDYCKVRNSV